MRSEEVRNNVEYPPEFKKTLMTGRLIGAAIVSSLFLYFLVVVFLKAHFKPFLGVSRVQWLQTLRLGFFGAAAVVSILNRLINGRLLKNRIQGDFNRGLRSLFRASVISLALAEVPALIGLVLFLLRGLEMDFYVLLFVSLMLVFMYFPRQKNWEAYLQDQPLSCRLEVR
jgi:F0F1-type ATP synthase membrane subunit c/vacuolar-type H+-ATPase subunit K